MSSIRRFWWAGLTGILALYYLVIGVLSWGTIGPVAIVGAIFIGSALLVRRSSRRAAGALLIVGVVPLAFLTWWSLLTPILAVLALLCGGLAIGTGHRTGA